MITKIFRKNNKFELHFFVSGNRSSLDKRGVEIYESMSLVRARTRELIIAELDRKLDDALFAITYNETPVVKIDSCLDYEIGARAM